MESTITIFNHHIPTNKILQQASHKHVTDLIYNLCMLALTLIHNLKSNSQFDNKCLVSACLQHAGKSLTHTTACLAAT